MRRRGTRRRLALAVGCVALLVGGCGYHLGYPRPAGLETVAVPVFDNRSRRREAGIELTRAVTAEILRRTDWRLVSRPEDADLILRGTIRSLSERLTVEGPNDEPLSGTSTIVLLLRIERRGAPVRERRIEVTVDFAPDSGVAGVSDASLRDPWRELFALAAERVAMALEGPEPAAQRKEGGSAWRASTGEAASPP